MHESSAYKIKSNEYIHMWLNGGTDKSGAGTRRCKHVWYGVRHEGTCWLILWPSHPNPYWLGRQIYPHSYWDATMDAVWNRLPSAPRSAIGLCHLADIWKQLSRRLRRTATYDLSDLKSIFLTHGNEFRIAVGVVNTCMRSWKPPEKTKQTLSQDLVPTASFLQDPLIRWLSSSFKISLVFGIPQANGFHFSRSIWLIQVCIASFYLTDKEYRTSELR